MRRWWLQRHRHVLRLPGRQGHRHPRRGGRRPRRRPEAGLQGREGALGDAVRRHARRPARVADLLVADRERADHWVPLDQRRPRLPRRGPAARLAEGLWARHLCRCHRHTGARGDAGRVAHGGHHPGAGAVARLVALHGVVQEVAEGQQGPCEPLRPGRQGHAQRRQGARGEAQGLSGEREHALYGMSATSHFESKASRPRLCTCTPLAGRSCRGTGVTPILCGQRPACVLRYGP
mmetsp:Transcript_66655/g.184183  ORF Transcript_66655/g.184183 Transcript_66655/m.184183 type:complete len:235 (-) Transcript_66655:134-838(-)